MLRCGLLGQRLGHSYSPAIHALLGDYAYALYEREPESLGAFLDSGCFDGLNVTIPYKKAVLPYCAALSDTARALGSVNTLVRRSDGTLWGDNTDAFGFASMVRRAGISPAGKKALVLGSGGASVTVCDVLRRMGASEVVVISRSGPNRYENLEDHADASLVVNATPVGMYPNCGAAPVDLRRLRRCEGVLDLIYNPARTALLLQAESLGIPCLNGLHMLVAQAKRSSELFTDATIEDGAIDRIESALRRSMQNIILIGMPGCGKTTIANALGQALGRPVYDADTLVEEQAGQTIPELFAQNGEADFRRRETQALAQLGKLSGIVLSTGGGCVLREENYALLHQNGVIVHLRRPLSQLAVDGRPISLSCDLSQLQRQRLPLYQRFADCTVDNDTAPEETARRLLQCLGYPL